MGVDRRHRPQDRSRSRAAPAKRSVAASNPVTLGDLIRDSKLLWVYCRDCGHERDIDPSTLALPRTVAVPDVGQRMRCSRCSSRKIATEPELYPGGIFTQRTRWRRRYDGQSDPSKT
jgi:hypothetical protein